MTRLTRNTCVEAFRRLDDYLDHELGPDEMHQVEEHLKVCTVCAKEFAFEAGVLRGIREKLSAPQVPAELQSRIRELLAAEPSGPGRAD
jgi:anti-sigma factor (TIGR02949 family)